MKKRIFPLMVLALLLLAQCTSPQRVDLATQAARLEKAQEILQNAGEALPADSVFIRKERQRVEHRFRLLADSLKHHAPDSLYAHFALERYLWYAYQSQNIKTLLPWHDSLIALAAAYPQYIEQNRKAAMAVAQCVVNSLEGSGLISENDLLKYAERAAEENISQVYGAKATLEQKRKVVDRYAVQYASRGIISMAEPFYAHFADLYKRPEKKAKPIRFTKDYMVYEKNGLPVTNFSALEKSWLFMAFNQRHANFDLVELISIIRAAHEDNASIPFVIARNPHQFNDKVIKGVGRNISGEFAYITLNKKDSAYYSNAPAFVVLKPGGKIYYATNNAIDFLQWLRAPKAKQKAEEEKERKARLQAIIARRKKREALPPDTSVKLVKDFPQLQVVLKGEWPKEATVEVHDFYFGEALPYHAPEPGIAEVDVKVKNRRLYNQWVVHEPGQAPIRLSLLQGKKHKISVRFNDSTNAYGLKQLHQLEKDQGNLRIYREIAAEYPFVNTPFYRHVQKQIHALQTGLDRLAGQEKNRVVAAILGVSRVFNRLQHPADKKKIDYHTFDSIMSVPHFDTLLYRSPFYGPVVRGWLRYGAADLPTAIDLLFSSKQWIPENHKATAMQYVWRQMNTMGREDMMAYIDTVYLEGCAGRSNAVQQRIAGYRRMAPGHKAPDIRWTENGNKMDLYRLKADSVYVVFWADWCGHCKQFIPGFYRKLKNSKHTQVVAVCVDSTDSSLKLGKKLFPQWHHVWASGKWKDPLVEKYNVFATPTVYLLDKDGVIVKKLGVR